MSDSLKILYSRPGMYIEPHEQKIDAAGFITRFLDAVLEPREVTCPRSIHITLSGMYLSMEATMCRIDRNPPPFHTFLSMLDPAGFRKPASDDGYVLELMRSIIWFSEYCLANITIDEKMFQQAFWRAKPFEEQPKNYLGAELPRIGFCITLPPELFQERMLKIERLRRVIDLWEGRRVEFASPEVIERLRKFDRHWMQQSKHHFSLKFQRPVVMWCN